MEVNIAVLIPIRETLYHNIKISADSSFHLSISQQNFTHYFSKEIFSVFLPLHRVVDEFQRPQYAVLNNRFNIYRQSIKSKISITFIRY